MKGHTWQEQTSANTSLMLATFFEQAHVILEWSDM